jgi:hypothetical protein
VRGKTWHIVFILSRRTEIWKFVRLSDMLIVALPVWFVMGFADVYRKCKKMWMEREFSEGNITAWRIKYHSKS